MPEFVKNDFKILLKPGYVLIPTDDGYLIDGGISLEHITGPLASTALPTMINGAADQSEHVPFAEEVVKALETWGIFARSTKDQECLRSPIASYLDRLGDHQRWESRTNSGASVFRIVCERELLGLCSLIRANLSACGMESSLAVDSLSDVSEREGPLNILLVNLEGRSDSEDLRRLIEHKNTFFRVAVNVRKGVVEFGPYLNGALMRDEGGWRGGAAGSVKQTDSGKGDNDELVIAQIITSLIVSRLLHIALDSSLLSPVSYLRFEVEDMTATWLSWREEQLRSEDAAQFQGALTRRLIQAFEARIGMRAVIKRPPSRPTRTIARALDFHYHSSSVFELPPVELSLEETIGNSMRRSIRSREKRLDLRLWSLLLGLTFGIKMRGPSGDRKWLPSAGNLASQEVLVLSNGCSGLPDGTFVYIPELHLLKRFSSPAHSKIRAIPELSTGNHLIVVANANRLVGKYKEFSYKLAYLDAGVAVSQSMLVAGALSLRIEEVSNLRRSQLGAALNFVPGTRVAASVLALDTQCDSSGQIRKLGSSRDFAERPLDESIELRDADFEIRKILSAKRFGSRFFNGLHRSDPELSASLGDILNRRRSTRSFDCRPIEVNKIATLIRTLVEMEPMDSSFLETHLLTRPDAEGQYRARRISTRRETYTDRDALIKSSDIWIADEYGDPPSVFLFSLDLALIKQPGDYERYLQLAGFLAHRLSLASISVGLQGTLVAGLRRFIHNLHSSDQVSLLAYICGERGDSAEFHTK